MLIKLKNKSEIYVDSSTYPYDKTCEWCGKVIKGGKRPYFYSFDLSPYDLSPYDNFCSVPHLKAAANAAL